MTFSPSPALWTAEEAAGLRTLYEANDWARQKFAQLAKEQKGKTFINLYRYQVLGDEKAGEAERKYLLSFIDARLEGKDTGGRRVGRRAPGGDGQTRGPAGNWSTHDGKGSPAVGGDVDLRKKWWTAGKGLDHHHDGVIRLVAG